MYAESRRLLAAFRSRDFRLLWSGELLSFVGTAMFYVAISWQLYLLTHSAVALGLLGVIRVLPTLLLSLPGGNVADASNRKKILFVTQSIFALSSLFLALVTFMRVASPWLLYLVVGLVEATVAFDHPARSAFIPSLVEQQEVTNAMSVYEIQYQFTTLVGPVLAGWLLSSIGAGGVYAIDAVSTLAVLLSLLLIKQVGEPSGDRTPMSLASMKEGFAFVRSNRLLWSSILLDSFATFFASAMALLPIYANEVLRVGPQGLGLLYAAPALGAMLAGVLMASWSRHIHRQGRALLLTVMLYALATMVFGLSRFYPLSLFALALAGGFDSVSVILRGSLQLRVTPDALRGRLSSITMIFWMGGPQLGDFEAGLLAAVIGAPLAVTLGGISAVVFVGIMALAFPQLRTYHVEE